MDTKEYYEGVFQDDWQGHCLTFNRANKYIVTLPEYETVLDIGCADGKFLKLYLGQYPKTKTFGIDIAERAIAMAVKNVPYAHLRTQSVYDLPYADMFDMIHAYNVLEFLPDPGMAFDIIHRALKPGGEMIITTPSGNLPQRVWEWNNGIRSQEATRFNEEMLSKFELVEHLPQGDQEICLLKRYKKL